MVIGVYQLALVDIFKDCVLFNERFQTLALRPEHRAVKNHELLVRRQQAGQVSGVFALVLYVALIHIVKDVVKVSERLAHVVLLLEYKSKERILYDLKRHGFGHVLSVGNGVEYLFKHLMFFAEGRLVKIFKTLAPRFFT